MMIKFLTRTVLVGLVALTLLPAQAWGQDRVIEAAEISTLDFRISNMGPDGDVNFDALHPTVVYNSTDQEYLVVWAGDHSADGDVEIYGQRLNALTGERLEQAFRISDMGPDGDPAFDAFTPAVAYNSTDNMYLVVWAGLDGPDSELAVYGQRLNAATGAEVGANDFRITRTTARYPDVVYNGAQSEYFVVWQGAEDHDARTVEIFGQRLDAASGEAVGLGASRISNVGDAESQGAHRPALVYNEADNEYFVAWHGGEEATPRAMEIFGQRLNAATGDVLGAEDVRISDMGPDDDPAFFAYEPAVAYNRASHEYLVVWVGDDDTAAMVDNELEVFGQRLDAATLKAVGVNDFRISAMGPDGDPAFGAALPDVIYNAVDDEYLVVWRGDHNGEALVDGEHEIFGQRLFGSLQAGDERGDDDFRISHMGSLDGQAGFDAIQAAVVYGGDTYLAVWYGDDDDASVDNEHEIFGRRIDAGVTLAIELSDFTAVVEGEDVFLKWTTALEQDNARFEIEHKTTDAYAVAGFANTGADARQYAYTVTGLDPGRHTFRLKQADLAGEALYSAEIEVIIEVPGGFLLTGAYPNPFNSSTTLTLTLSEQQNVEIMVFDMLGRKVTTLYDGVIEAHVQRSFAFKAASLPSGSYFVRVVGESFVDTQQVLLVR